MDPKSSEESEEEDLDWERIMESGDMDILMDIVMDTSDTTRLKAQSLDWQDALHAVISMFIIIYRDDDSRRSATRFVAAVVQRFPRAIAAFEHPLPFTPEHDALGIDLVLMLGYLADMRHTYPTLLSSLKHYAIPSISFITWLELADLPFDPEQFLLASKECYRIINIEKDLGRATAASVVEKVGSKAVANQIDTYFRRPEVVGMAFVNVILVTMSVCNSRGVVRQLFEKQTLKRVVQTIWKELKGNTMQSHQGSRVLWIGLTFIMQALWTPDGLLEPGSLTAAADLVRGCDLINLCAFGLYYYLTTPHPDGTYSKSELVQLRHFVQDVIRACHAQPDLIATHVQPYLLPFLDHVRDLDWPHLGDHKKNVVLIWSGLVEIACGTSEATLRSQARQAEIDQRKINTGGLVGCSWYQCIFHQGEARGAMTIAMLLDDRCQRAQYCSRYCQKRDWHDGDHKSVCRAV